MARAHVRIDKADIRKDLARISGATLKVLVCLLSHENGKTGVCCPSYETIMAETGIGSKSTVKRSLEWLVAHEYIEIQHKALRSGRYYNTYWILKYTDCT